MHTVHQKELMPPELPVPMTWSSTPWHIAPLFRLDAECTADCDASRAAGATGGTSILTILAVVDAPP